jgi:hypothetical protein
MKKIVFLLLSLIIYQVGSSQIRVSYNKVDNIDFSKFKTYQVYSLDVVTIPEFEAKKEGLTLLIMEIDKQMKARGFEKVKENPDLLINLGVDIGEETQTRQTDFRDAPIYMGQRNYHWESEEIVVRKYIEGTVTLDLVSSQDNEMIWQAVGTAVLEKKREKNKKKIVKGVMKMFKKFPVKVKE